MNPMQAIMGAFTPANSTAGQSAYPMANGSFGALQGVMQRASQLAQTLQNPQQMIQQFFPNAPEEVRSDPDMLANWLQQSGMVSPQIVQMARQMCGR